ncbi:MAG: hypothetical protein JSR82_24525 [Verrucomicrobia bacterium]|nr:hypothetical protein [Verrucomicrobiota bacterium]
MHTEDDVIGRSWFLVRETPEEVWTTDRHASAVWEWEQANEIARRLGAFPVVVEPESAEVIGCIDSARPRGQEVRPSGEARRLAEYQKRLEALKLA